MSSAICYDDPHKMSAANPCPRPSNAAAAAPMNLFKLLVGNCYCEPAANIMEGINPTVQFVELHGIRFIGLGCMSDELTARERVYDTLEQLTDRSERLMSIGYVVNDPNSSQKVTQTIPLDVWIKSYELQGNNKNGGGGSQLRNSPTNSKNGRKDKSVANYNMSRPVQNLVEQIMNKDYRSAKLHLSMQLSAQKKVRTGNNLYLAGITAHNLAVVKILSGEKEEDDISVVELFQEAITLKQEAFGPSHLEVAYSWDELGIQWFARCEFEKALSAFEQAQKVRRVCVDPAGMAMVLNNIACGNFSLKNYKSALSTLQEALQIMQQTKNNDTVAVSSFSSSFLPSGHAGAQIDLDLLHHAIVMNNCGYLHLCLKLYDEARSLFEEALLIQQSVLDESHRAIRDTRSNLDFTNAFHT